MTAAPGRTAARRWVLALAIAGSCIAAARTTPIERLQLQWLDTSFHLLRAVNERRDTAHVTVVGIDQASVSASGKPLALMLDEFALVLDGLRFGRAAAVGVDLVFPAASFDSLVPGAARRLAVAIGRLRAEAPVVLGWFNGAPTGDASVLYRAMAGVDGEGLLLAPADSDGALRRIEEVAGRSDVLLAPRIAARLGHEPRAGIVDFSIGTRYDYLPLHTVVTLVREGNAAALRQRFEGRVVLLGTILPDQDRQRVPLPMAAWEDGMTVPGVLFQAQALRSLLHGRMIRGLPFLSDATAVAIILLLWVWRPQRTRALAGVLGLGAASAGASLALLDAGMYLPIAAPLLTLLLGTGTLAAQAYLRELSEQRRLRSIFAGYVSPPILDTILSGALRDGLAGRRQQLAFLFADIRGFTAFCAVTPPEGVIAFLNRYYTAITPALHHRGGTVDKFSGDGIMVFFGAPQPSTNPARDAVLAAMAMLDALSILNAELAKEGQQPIRVGIGIAYGDAVLGNVGSQLRHDYTATGAATTRAAHIQQHCKQVQHALLVEQTAFDLADLPPASRAQFEIMQVNLEKHGTLVLAGHA